MQVSVTQKPRTNIQLVWLQKRRLGKKAPGPLLLLTQVAGPVMGGLRARGAYFLVTVVGPI